MSPGVRRILAIVLLGVLPVVTAVVMFAVAHDSGSLARDFHNELYPEAQHLLDWENPFPGPDHPLEYGHNPIWPPVAAFLVSPLTVLSPGAADWVMALLGARRCDALAAHRRRPRLARVRGVRAVAARDRRDPRGAPDAVPLRARRARLALPRRPLRTGPRRRARRRREVLPLAARRLARSDGQGSGDARRRRRSPAPRCSSSSRSRDWTTTSAPCSSSETRSTRTATRRSASSCRSARRSGSRAPRRS